MRLVPDDLTTHLHAELLPFYLVHGEEHLLIEESCDMVRRAAREQGYMERTRWVVEPSFSWDAVTQDSASLSLFSSRRLIEIRMPNGRPGEAGGRVLTTLAQAPPPDTVYLLITGKLDRRTRQSRWYKSIVGAGADLEHRAVGADRLPAWLQHRFRSKGLRYTDGVIESLAHYLEGNLLAAAQEVDKLELLAGGNAVTLADVQGLIADSARFSAFSFVDACMLGRAEKAIRSLGALQAEGVAPALLLWALARETRETVKIAWAIASGQPRAQVFKAHNVWSSRVAMVTAAIRRLDHNAWMGVLQRVARLDRVLKGRLEGDIWNELEALALVMCKIPTASGKYVTL